MVQSGSRFDLDLLLVRPPGGVRVGIEHALRNAIRSSQLLPGTRMPSTRTLARDLDVSRNSVIAAYGQLTEEGWLVTAPQSGTTVAPHAMAPSSTTDGLNLPRRMRSRLDLRPGWPDLSSFPRQEWLAAARRALTQAPAEAFGYGDHRGRVELRQAVAAYLSRVRGVVVNQEQVVICAGISGGLGLVARVMRVRGMTTWVTESHGIDFVHQEPGLRHGFASGTVSVDEDGACVHELEAIPDGQAVVLLTPAHQYPLGVALSSNRRTTLINWARETGNLVVEDDYDGEFRYDRRPVGALQALAPDHVVYAGTTSKALAPGLRLGWLVMPRHLMEETTRVKTLAEGQSSSLEQLTLADFLSSGGYDRQVRRSRLRYRNRRDLLTRAVAKAVPGLTITGTAAGMHALIWLPEGQDESESSSSPLSSSSRSKASDSTRWELVRHRVQPSSSDMERHPTALTREAFRRSAPFSGQRSIPGSE